MSRTCASTLKTMAVCEDAKNSSFQFQSDVENDGHILDIFWRNVSISQKSATFNHGAVRVDWCLRPRLLQALRKSTLMAFNMFVMVASGTGLANMSASISVWGLLPPRITTCFLNNKSTCFGRPWTRQHAIVISACKWIFLWRCTRMVLHRGICHPVNCQSVLDKSHHIARRCILRNVSGSLFVLGARELKHAKSRGMDQTICVWHAMEALCCNVDVSTCLVPDSAKCLFCHRRCLDMFHAAPRHRSRRLPHRIATRTAPSNVCPLYLMRCVPCLIIATRRRSRESSQVCVRCPVLLRGGCDMNLWTGRCAPTKRAGRRSA